MTAEVATAWPKHVAAAVERIPSWDRDGRASIGLLRVTRFIMSHR